MVKLKHAHAIIAGVLACGGVIVLAFFFFGETPEERIRDRFETLATVLSKDAGEADTKLLFVTQRLTGFFCDPCRIHTVTYDFRQELSPQEIAANIARLRKQSRHVNVSFHDVDVDLISETKATVHCTGYVDGSTGGETVRDAGEFRFKLTKTEGKWRICEVTEVEVLKK